MHVTLCNVNTKKDADHPPANPMLQLAAVATTC